MLRGLIENIDNRKKDTQSENTTIQASTQSTLKRLFPTQSPILSSSPLLSQKLTNLTVSPVRKTVKFDYNFTQYNISDDEDDELFALLENIEHEKNANVITQVALENESFDSGILFSGNDSLFDASFAENNTLKTIDPGMSLEVGLAKDVVDQSEAEDEIISLSSVYAATNSITMESKYVPKLMTTEFFSLEQLAYNIKNINPTLALDTLSVLFGLDVPRRLVGPAALMVQKVRKIGPTMQMTFIDGKGTEIVGTMCGNSLPDCKVHYGMIVILQDVSVLSPIPTVKFLNITANNIVNVYENVHRIN